MEEQKQEYQEEDQEEIIEEFEQPNIIQLPQASDFFIDMDLGL